MTKESWQDKRGRLWNSLKELFGSETKSLPLQETSLESLQPLSSGTNPGPGEPPPLENTSSPKLMDLDINTMSNIEMFESLFVSDIASFFLNKFPREKIDQELVETVMLDCTKLAMEMIEVYSIVSGCPRTDLQRMFDERRKRAIVSVQFEVVRQNLDPKEFN